MVWGTGVANIATNLGISAEVTILIVTCLGCLIFFAKDFLLGMIMLFLCGSLNFALGYYMEVNYLPALIVMFMTFILMALSLYIVGQTKAQGGYI